MAARETFVDASRLGWDEFVALLREHQAASGGGAFVRVMPPARCAYEAARVVRDLELDGSVELLDAVPSPAVRQAQRRSARPLQRMLAALL